MVALIASIFSLCVGPLFYQVFGPMRRTDKIVGGIVQVVVCGVVALEVIPNSYDTIKFWAILLALLGFAGPTYIEKTFKQAANTTHKATIYLGILGLIIHAFIDGAAIQSEQHSNSAGLSLAIILHRLPVGLTIWWMLKPLLGERYALITLLLMALSTFLGFTLNQSLVSYQDNLWFAITQAFIAGSLLHVVIHKPHSDGCMHTSHSHRNHSHQKHSHDIHNHNHHSHHHKNDSQNQHSHAHDSQTTNKSITIAQYIYRWETVGMALGFAILIILEINH